MLLKLCVREWENEDYEQCSDEEIIELLQKGEHSVEDYLIKKISPWY